MANTIIATIAKTTNGHIKIKGSATNALDNFYSSNTPVKFIPLRADSSTNGVVDKITLIIGGDSYDLIPRQLNTADYNVVDITGAAGTPFNSVSLLHAALLTFFG